MSEKHTILYVDDDQENLDAFHSIFRRDFHVLVTKDPLEAIKMLQAHVVKVIISDQRMPSMSGVEFLKTTLAENPKPTRILLTGYADMNAVVAAINEGRIFMYLSKPWNEDELRGQLERAVRQYEVGSEQQFLVLRLKEYNQLLEEKVSHRTKSLMETNTRLHSFMKIAAHDLKNPLTAIRSSAEILGHNGANMTPEKRNHHASGIVDSADRMLGIITHILEDSRRHQGSFSPLMDAINVHDVIQASIRDNTLLAEQKHITITLEANDQEHSAVIWADRLGVQQILDNFLSNAIKFSPTHKNVRVRVMANPEIRKVLIAVCDEGPGISEEDQRQLFKEYSQLSAKPTAGESSTGLGLFIVKSFAHVMGGKVWCDSVLGEGATFTVEFDMSA